MNLLLVEMRRALHRRAIRVLILVAVGWCVLAGVIAFTGSAGKTVAELHAHGNQHPAVLVDWWSARQAKGMVLTAAIFLFIGGFLAGAAVTGAEWRAGTVTTLLTWEPRRARLLLTRLAACFVLALVIGFALVAVFLAVLLPAVLAHGTTAGADAAWWGSLLLVMLRIALLTAVAAVVGASLASLGRNTAFALAAVFAWMAVVEGVVRGLRPGWAQYLWAENIATVVGWSQIREVDFSRGPLLALGTVAGYAGVLVLTAVWTFRRRDLASAA